MIIKRKRIQPSNILVAKEFFKIDKDLAIVRIDDTPDAIDDGINFVNECREKGVNFKSFRGLILVPGRRINVVRNMDTEDAERVLTGIIKHLNYSISKLKKYYS